MPGAFLAVEEDDDASMDCWIISCSGFVDGPGPLPPMLASVRQGADWELSEQDLLRIEVVLGMGIPSRGPLDLTPFGGIANGSATGAHRPWR